MSEWQQVQDIPGYFDNADYDENKGVFTYARAVDVAPVIEANLEAQKDPQNGFFQERLGRHIGEIPEIIYYSDVLPKFRLFEKEFAGDDLRMKKGEYLKSFLNEHPQYRTVDAILHKSPNPNILIK